MEGRAEPVKNVPTLAMLKPVVFLHTYKCHITLTQANYWNHGNQAHRESSLILCNCCELFGWTLTSRLSTLQGMQLLFPWRMYLEKKKICFSFCLFLSQLQMTLQGMSSCVQATEMEILLVLSSLIEIICLFPVYTCVPLPHLIAEMNVIHCHSLGNLIRGSGPPLRIFICSCHEIFICLENK